jgi:hypothetical protein
MPVDSALTVEVQRLADKFARYLCAWTDETDLGEPDFDGITSVTELARFLARLALNSPVGR